jgi:monovalent cation:H+ antiporter, CPA1 family
VHSPFDLLALLLVISAGLAYLNHRILKLPLTVGLLVGAAVGALLLIALDTVLPGLGLKLAIRGLAGSINFPADPAQRLPRLPPLCRRSPSQFRRHVFA